MPIYSHHSTFGPKANYVKFSSQFQHAKRSRADPVDSAPDIGLVLCRDVPHLNHVLAQGGQSGVGVDKDVEISDFGARALAPHDILNMVLAEGKLRRWQTRLRRAIERTTPDLGLAGGLPSSGATAARYAYQLLRLHDGQRQLAPKQGRRLRCCVSLITNLPPRFFGRGWNGLKLIKTRGGKII